MYCNKCGNELEEGVIFCNKCGTKVGEKSNTDERKVKKQNNKTHWIKNTTISIKCKENEKIRKVVAMSIMIIIIFLIFNFFFGVGNYLDNDRQLGIGKGVNDFNEIKYYESKVNFAKFQMIGSIIGGILVFNYGKKIIEKD